MKEHGPPSDDSVPLQPRIDRFPDEVPIGNESTDDRADDQNPQHAIFRYVCRPRETESGKDKRAGAACSNAATEVP
jgi:hypothetical protein